MTTSNNLCQSILISGEGEGHTQIAQAVRK